MCATVFPPGRSSVWIDTCRGARGVRLRPGNGRTSSNEAPALRPLGGLMRPTALMLLLVAPIWALRPQDTASARRALTEGSRIEVPGGRIWYRVVGRGSGTPVVLLHGGPGNPSVYLKSLEALGDDRLVVRYDQLGAGYSDVVHDTSLFNIARFVEELELLRRHLALDR